MIRVARHCHVLSRLRARINDHLFFGGMAILLSASVALGFARTYFLAGFVHAPLANRIVHVHGIIFSLWFVLLLWQAFLISVGRLQWHRRLGLVTYGLALLIVISGVQVATDSLRRGAHIGSFDVSVSYAISVMDMVAFAIVIFASYSARERPDAHKRYILFATLSIVDAAIDRWPYREMGMDFSAHTSIYISFLLLPVIYDLISLHGIHPSTRWAGPLVYLLNTFRIPIGKTQLWADFAHAMARHQ
jgi:hypothetical protein